MIVNLEVDGFKSLADFKVTFQPGLNVLIGPNGSGKSNICQALGLISAAASNNVAYYLLSLGGVEAVFSRNPASSQGGKKLTVSCGGVTSALLSGKNYVYLSYDYRLELSLGKELIIGTEVLEISKYNKHTKKAVKLWTFTSHEGQLEVKLTGLNQAGPMATNIFKKEAESYKFPLRGRAGPLNTMFVIVGGLSYYGYIVSEDMRLSRAWNIDPAIARRPSDMLESSIMLPDGHHLANAVGHFLTRNKDEIERVNALLRRVTTDFDHIESEPSVSLPSVGSKRSFFVRDKAGIAWPASSISDGTVKLIALLVALEGMTQSTAIIEEPENYLHPWACQSLIEYFRDVYKDRVCVITTHSETILNTATPQEIIVIEKDGGRTKQHRVGDDKDLSAAIASSGFGCGYHYTAGSLGGTPS